MTGNCLATSRPILSFDKVNACCYEFALKCQYMQHSCSLFGSAAWQFSLFVIQMC